MMSIQNKTLPTEASFEEFLNTVENPLRKSEAIILSDIMKHITGHAPVMWGPSIVGFGKYHYKYESGREGDMCVLGFSPRKADLSIYFVDGFTNYEADLLKLGPHKCARACLYIKKLELIDQKVLTSMLTKSYEHVMKHIHTA